MTNILSPVGRIVQGSLSHPNTRDYDGNPLVWKSGDAEGQPRQEWFIGLAISKQDPKIGEVFAAMNAEAAAGFPGGESQRHGFAWKMIDGDTSLDKNGKPYSEREGHAGCYIFRLTTSYCPKAYAWGNGSWVEVDLAKIKTGDYVAVDMGIEANRNPRQPGLFMNLNMIQWVGEGQAIVTGPNVQERFGSGPAALPAGAVAPNLTATPGAPGATPGYASPGVPGGVPAAPAAAPAAAPTAAPAAAPAAAAPAQPAAVPAAPVAAPAAPVAAPAAPAAAPAAPAAVPGPAPAAAPAAPNANFTAPPQ